MLSDTLTHTTSISLSPTHQSGWIATVMFFSTNVGSAIVMLITALLFTLVTLLMVLVLIKVSKTRKSTHARVRLYSSLMSDCISRTLNEQSGLMLQVHRLYRGGGGSLERAQEEWSTGLWKNAPVREAGLNAVAHTAQGPSLPEYPASVPSYPPNSNW